MIKYSLQCEYAHGFEAWFASSDAYDQQVVAGQVACPHCGSLAVSKAIMAPNVVTSRAKVAAESAEMKARRQMAEMAHQVRNHVEANFDYVGDSFASEARDMHDGLTEHRPIYGEATGEEVKSLIEDGISVAPIPQTIPVASQPVAPTVPAKPKPARISAHKSRLN